MRPFSTKSVPSVDTMTLTRGTGISGQPTKLIEIAMKPPERLSRGEIVTRSVRAYWDVSRNQVHGSGQVTKVLRFIRRKTDSKYR